MQLKRVTSHRVVKNKVAFHYLARSCRVLANRKALSQFCRPSWSRNDLEPNQLSKSKILDGLLYYNLHVDTICGYVWYILCLWFLIILDQCDSGSVIGSMPLRNVNKIYFSNKYFVQCRELLYPIRGFTLFVVWKQLWLK